MCGRFNFSNHSKVKGTKEAGIKSSFILLFKLSG